jgi:hypothetical protein
MGSDKRRPCVAARQSAGRVNHCVHRESWLPATLKGIAAREPYEDVPACSPHDRILVAVHDDCRHGRDPGRTKES